MPPLFNGGGTRSLVKILGLESGLDWDHWKYVMTAHTDTLNQLQRITR